MGSFQWMRKMKLRRSGIYPLLLLQESMRWLMSPHCLCSPVLAWLQEQELQKQHKYLYCKGISSVLFNMEWSNMPTEQSSKSCTGDLSFQLKAYTDAVFSLSVKVIGDIISSLIYLWQSEPFLFSGETLHKRLVLSWQCLLLFFYCVPPSPVLLYYTTQRYYSNMKTNVNTRGQWQQTYDCWGWTLCIFLLKFTSQRTEGRELSPVRMSFVTFCCFLNASVITVTVYSAPGLRPSRVHDVTVLLNVRLQISASSWLSVTQNASLCPGPGCQETLMLV